MTNHYVSLLEKAGSTVVEYFEWDLPKVLSQGGAELLQYADDRRLSSEPDVVESGKGYSVLLANCPAICSVIFVKSCHF